MGDWVMCTILAAGAAVDHGVRTRLPHRLLERGCQALQDMSCKLVAFGWHLVQKIEQRLRDLQDLQVPSLPAWFSFGGFLKCVIPKRISTGFTDFQG